MRVLPFKRSLAPKSLRRNAFKMWLTCDWQVRSLRYASGMHTFYCFNSNTFSHQWWGKGMKKIDQRFRFGLWGLSISLYHTHTHTHSRMLACRFTCKRATPRVRKLFMVKVGRKCKHMSGILWKDKYFTPFPPFISLRDPLLLTSSVPPPSSSNISHSAPCLSAEGGT